MRNAFLSTVPGRPPLCSPKTSARPPPTCPASPRQRPSCSPKRGCRGVGLPVGTRRLPRLGGGDLLPSGSSSRWSAKVVKHEKSPSSGPMGHGKGRIRFLDSGEKNTIPSHQALWLLTLLATARMIGHHLNHCQTPSKIINGLTLLRAWKSPAEHVGRLVYNKKYSLHRFT